VSTADGRADARSASIPFSSGASASGSPGALLLPALSPRVVPVASWCSTDPSEYTSDAVVGVSPRVTSGAAWAPRDGWAAISAGVSTLARRPRSSSFTPPCAVTITADGASAPCATGVGRACAAARAPAISAPMYASSDSQLCGSAGRVVPGWKYVTSARSCRPCTSSWATNADPGASPLSWMVAMRTSRTSAAARAARSSVSAACGLRARAPGARHCTANTRSKPCRP
jgi:hypothetical protein